MIKKLTAETVTQFSKKNSSLIATVVQLEINKNATTTITLSDSEDYDYVHSVYHEKLSEDRIVELVDIAFIQANKISKPALKYGEPTPEIDEHLDCVTTLTTEYFSMSEFHGKKVEVLSVIANPDDDKSIIDVERMPVFHVRMIGTDKTSTADSYELSDYKHPQMEAVLKGLNYETLEDNCSDDEKQFYLFGTLLADLRN